MDPAATERAAAAAMGIARSIGLPADQAVVLQDSNKLALRLLPSDVFARVAPIGAQHAAFEVPLALRLTEAGCPIATLDPRVDARGYEHDGFEVTFWTYLPPITPVVAHAGYADALHRLHAGMRSIEEATPRFTDRVREAEEILESPHRSPSLSAEDRDLALGTLRRSRASIIDRAPTEQLLHGEPHPGNVLDTERGVRFIDLETCCRGPVEFDLAHVPAEVADLYPGIDRSLLDDCRALVLAMVAAWRFDPQDQLPDGARFGRALIAALRAGRSWPTIDVVFGG